MFFFSLDISSRVCHAPARAHLKAQEWSILSHFIDDWSRIVLAGVGIAFQLVGAFAVRAEVLCFEFDQFDLEFEIRDGIFNHRRCFFEARKRRLISLDASQ
jgi:hypothetical protein